MTFLSCSIQILQTTSCAINIAYPYLQLPCYDIMYKHNDLVLVSLVRQEGTFYIMWAHQTSWRHWYWIPTCWSLSSSPMVYKVNDLSKWFVTPCKFFDWNESKDCLWMNLTKPGFHTHFSPSHILVPWVTQDAFAVACFEACRMSRNTQVNYKWIYDSGQSDSWL